MVRLPLAIYQQWRIYNDDVIILFNHKYMHRERQNKFRSQTQNSNELNKSHM